ncbi:hypothetical protein KDL45_17910, partial [bacterium]|nr:hypothetical protein [bacterium]
LHAHELAGCYVKMTSGAVAGRVYKIKANTRDHIVFDGENPYYDGAVSGDAFRIFENRLIGVPETDTQTAYRFMRLRIPQSSTNEGYFRIGALAVGPRHEVQTDTTVHKWQGLSNGRRFPVDMRDDDHGALVATRKGASRRTMGLSWDGMTPNQAEGFQQLVERTHGAVVPVVYLPKRRRATGDQARHIPEGFLARIRMTEHDVTPMSAAEVWQTGGIVLDEIDVGDV